VSLIHDALRRGQAASGGHSQRVAPPDSVLAALGYQTDRPKRARTAIVSGLAIIVVIGGAYGLLSFHGGAGHAPTATRIVRSAPPPRTVNNSAPHPQPSDHVATVQAKSTSAQASPAPPPVSTTRHAAPVAADPPAASIANSLSLRSPAAGARPAVLEARTPAPASPLPRPPSRERTSGAAVSGPDDFQLALYYQRSGDFEQSLVHYKAVIGRDELNVEAHNNLGRLYLDKGLTDDAVREFQRVAAIDPRYVQARVNLAAAYFKQGHYDLSSAEARAALALEPRNVDALVNLALAEKAAGQVADARESLLAALRIDQHNAAAHYNLARQYEEVGESALALSHYEAFLKYAGPEQAAFAPDVRGRIAALSAKIK
jgi:Tfp pilus assembly protein PilF